MAASVVVLWNGAMFVADSRFWMVGVIWLGTVWYVGGVVSLLFFAVWPVGSSSRGLGLAVDSSSRRLGL